MQIKVPNLGDGVASAQVLSVLVAEGDMIEKDQTLLEVETDKAVAPIPATRAGKLIKLHVKEGDTVQTGLLVCDLASAESETEVVTANSDLDTPSSEGVVATLQTTLPTVPPVTPSPSVLPSILAEQTVYQDHNSGLPVPTSAGIRKAATLLGLNLNIIPGTGKGGRILLEDVQQYLVRLQQPSQPVAIPDQAAGSKTDATKAAVVTLPDFSTWGPIKEVPLTSLRKKIGEKMSSSWTTVPHVTQFADADITELLKLRQKYKGKFQDQGGKLTVMVMLFYVLTKALKEFPVFNSSFDSERHVTILKDYYHFGVAVDTEAGLIVPVLKNVDQKTLLDVSKDVVSLAEKARARSLSMDELQGGTFTISNLGSFGVGPFTPIVNVPEVAILGLGRSDIRIVPEDKRLVKHDILPLALSYDHRVIDGADAARFMAYLTDSLAAFDETILEEALDGSA
ncbi:MAG: 2-oxo acid dehydrogenase subunit E2 [bacterium]